MPILYVSASTNYKRTLYIKHKQTKLLGEKESGLSSSSGLDSLLDWKIIELNDTSSYHPST